MANFLDAALKTLLSRKRNQNHRISSHDARFGCVVLLGPYALIPWVLRGSFMGVMVIVLEVMMGFGAMQCWCHEQVSLRAVSFR